MTAAPWSELEQLLGREGFRREWAEAGEPMAWPADTEQTGAVVRWAGDHGVKIAAGSGARSRAMAALGRAPAAGRAVLGLDLARMNRLRFYEPGDLTAGWEAGVTAAEINATLAARGQFLPLDGGPDRASLGAILAAHRSGPLRQGYGTARDFVIGIEAVTAEGQIIHGGGRVVKNVAGYDLMRLLIGSGGTLAIITGVNCKVYPALRTTETMGFALPGWGAAERLRSRLLHSPLRLLALELGGGGEGAAGMRGLARFQGSDVVRARYRRELAAVGAELGLEARTVEAGEEAALWAQWEADPMPWRIGGPSGVAVELLRQTAALAEKQGCRLRLRGRLGVGVFDLALDPCPPEQGASRAEWNRSWRTMAAGVHSDAWLRDAAEPWAACASGGSGAAAGQDKSGGWMGRLRRHLDPAAVFAEAVA